MLSGWGSLTPPGQDTNPSQVSSQQMLVLIYLPRKDGKLSWLRRKRRSHKYSNLGRARIELGDLVVGRQRSYQLCQPRPRFNLYLFVITTNSFRPYRHFKAKLFIWPLLNSYCCFGFRLLVSPFFNHNIMYIEHSSRLYSIMRFNLYLSVINNDNLMSKLQIFASVFILRSFLISELNNVQSKM